jgi:hypothetical protein
MKEQTFDYVSRSFNTRVFVDKNSLFGVIFRFWEVNRSKVPNKTWGVPIGSLLENWTLSPWNPLLERSGGNQTLTHTVLLFSPSSSHDPLFFIVFVAQWTFSILNSVETASVPDCCAMQNPNGKTAPQIGGPNQSYKWVVAWIATWESVF